MASLLGGGCGDDDAGLRIFNFKDVPSCLQVNQPYTLKIVLSGEVGQRTFVDVVNHEEMKNFFDFERDHVTFDPPEKEQSLRVSGKASTNGQPRQIRFGIRDGTSEVVWRVEVGSC